MKLHNTAIQNLIRIFIFSIDNSLLDKDIFLIFLLGLNIIDWFAFIVAIIFQIFLFSIGMNFNKKLIKFSALFVYSGMLLFLFSIFLSDVKLTTSAFLSAISLNNLVDKVNFAPLITVSPAPTLTVVAFV